MSSRDRQRLEDLEKALTHLRHIAADGLMVVEGKRDVQALHDLAIVGEVTKLHRGRDLSRRIDDIAARADGRTAILLLDWDRTGGRLFRTMHNGLVGRVAVDAECRRRLALASHAKCVEHLPGELRALRRRVQRHRP